jgi:hypothetical protein
MRPKFFVKRVGRGQPRSGLWVVMCRGYADETGRVVMNFPIETFLGSEERQARQLERELNAAYLGWRKEIAA